MIAESARTVFELYIRGDVFCSETVIEHAKALRDEQRSANARRLSAIEAELEKMKCPT
jgi:hypothetical protein